MLAAPTEQRLTDAIDTVAAAAINTGARVTYLTAQYIDDEKALASVGIDPWTTRPSDDPTGQADRILYVGRDGAHIHIKAGRILIDAPGALPATSVPKNSVTRIVLSGNVGLSAGACCNAYFDALAACVPADVTFDGRSRRPPRDLPNAAPSYGYAILLSECVGALHAAGVEPSFASRTRPPISGPAWRWTSWNSSAHSWSTRPSWRSCARANSGSNTAFSRPRPGESGWAPTARKSSSTHTRPPVSDPSPAPSPDTRGRGAATSPTPRRC